ncbi:MAG: glutamate--tRNA ligase [Acidobacteria bacterium]|nr:glutamate--tRNA ligase [Acidobacteriota bacterium]
MAVRIRFAPSPTGYLHIGGARTALFNWLYARHHGGIFVLRIEDTDLERSSSEMVEGILEGLRWLGLAWDEGPFFQSQRLPLYQQACEQLRARGTAYPCFCSPQELESRKQASRESGSAWQYDRRCRDLSPAAVEEKLRQAQPHVLRFRVPEGRTVKFSDRVFGPIEVASESVEDFVLLRSDGRPTYHLCVVVDDVDMKISDVIRGADHLSNTSKHVLLFEAFDQPLPNFAHLPLILGTDKKRLSKRHGATSTLEYRKQGLLPEAMANYLALLGWSPGTDRELFSVSELVSLFDLDRVNRSNAVFDPAKLEWMNSQYLGSVAAERLAPEVKRLLQEAGLWNESWDAGGRDYFLTAVDLLKTRTRRLSDFVEFGRAFFTDDFNYQQEAVEKYLRPSPQLISALSELRAAYAGLKPFTLENTERVLREIADARAVKTGSLIGAVRLAMTGKSVAPGLFDVIITLGQEKTIQRLDRLLNFLASAPALKS